MNPVKKTLLIQIGLFLLTCLTVTVAGTEWMYGTPFVVFPEGTHWERFKEGFLFSVPFLGFLTTHEFGHYFMAKFRNVKVTLPYYIPFWLVLFTSIGTAGAFIQIKEKVKSKNDYFDIGIAGPLAGFVIAVGVLIYGYANIPGLEFLWNIHPDYEAFGANYGDFVYDDQKQALAVRIGDSVLSTWIKNWVADPSLIPHPNELSHYPIILAGYLGCFFTALNLMPIGQLDGGHILYALIGDRWFKVVSPILFISFLFFAGLGYFNLEQLGNTRVEGYGETLLYFALYIYFVYICCSRVTEDRKTNWVIALAVVLFQLLTTMAFPSVEGYSGFLLFAFLLGRVLGISHPPTTDTKPLGITRIVLGWISLVIFIISFSPYPIY